MAGCRHKDVHRFGEMRCCLSCGETVFESKPEPTVVSYPFESTAYQYKPLDQTLGEDIRLIVLYAGKSFDDLICDLVVVNLRDCPAYEAVSYTWADIYGDASLSSMIVCRGQAISITKNCEAALRRLRLESRSRRLWIDAICINQNDISEKNCQVRLMSHIYANASQVLAYVGMDSGEVTAGLRRIIDYIEDKKSIGFVLDDSNVKKNLMHFLALPYFDRVWVIQEIGLSRLSTFIVGAYEIRWTGATVSKLLDLCFIHAIQAPSVLRWNPARRPEEERDVLAVLRKSQNCSATDARDKVYALLGLIHPSFSARFAIDYSLSISEVYTRLAIYCIEEEGRFDVLQYCHSGLNKASQPSWVPRWDLHATYEPLPVQFLETQKRTFATAWHPRPTAGLSSWLRHELPRQLLVDKILNWLASNQDILVDTNNISTLACCELIGKWSEMHSIQDSPRKIVPEDDEYLAHRIVFEQSRDFTYQILQPHVLQRGAPGGPSAPYLKIRAHRLGNITRILGPISNSRHSQLPRTTWPALGSQLCQSCTKSGVSPLAREAYEKERAELISAIATDGAGAIAFATDFSAGFASGNVRCGMSIWILHGAEVPFILVRWKDHYTLFGDCYLHRAGRPFPCKHCGIDVTPWPMETEIVDIW